MLLSSGLSSWADLDAAVALLNDAGVDYAIFQCATSYPTTPEDVGLNIMGEMRRRYGCPVGLSDHSGKVFASHAAVALGASLIEVHVVFSRDCFGPDTVASLTIDELSTLVSGVEFIHRSLRNPVDKMAAYRGTEDLRQTFGKSLVAARDLEAGRQLREVDLALNKPGGGLPPRSFASVLGRKLKVNLRRDELLMEEMMDQAGQES